MWVVSKFSSNSLPEINIFKLSLPCLDDLTKSKLYLQGVLLTQRVIDFMCTAWDVCVLLLLFCCTESNFTHHKINFWNKRNPDFMIICHYNHCPNLTGKRSSTPNKHHSCLQTVKTEWGWLEMSTYIADIEGISIHHGDSHRQNSQHQGQTRSVWVQYTLCL